MVFVRYRHAKHLFRCDASRMLARFGVAFHSETNTDLRYLNPSTIIVLISGSCSTIRVTDMGDVPSDLPQMESYAALTAMVRFLSELHLRISSLSSAYNIHISVCFMIITQHNRFSACWSVGVFRL